MSDYRATAAKCPACGTMMEERGAGDAMVDVCPSCRGLWIDWFDGDTVDVATKAAPLSMRAPVPIDPQKAVCPRCQRPLEFDEVVHHHAAVVPAKIGPVIMRCGECGGTFIPRAAFNQVLDLAHLPEAEAPTGPLARLIAAIRRAFTQPPPS